MRKFIAAAAAFCLMATLLCGCRGNVSDQEDGIITDPTGTLATMPGTDTTPGLNTEPDMTTRPHTSTDSTDDTRDQNGSGSNGNAGNHNGTAATDPTEGMQGNARSRRPGDIK